MFWNVDTSTLMFGLTIVAVFAFVAGSILNAIMGENGFGSTGNALIVAIGFVGAIYLANRYGINLGNIKYIVVCGLVGGLALVSILAMLKIGLARR